MNNKPFPLLLSITLLAGLSGCVTQNYADSDTPVVQNESSNSEIALNRISLGLGYLKMGNTTQAKYNLERAKKYAPNSVQVYTAFAHYYETVGEDSLTMQAYEKALSLKPDDANTLNNYGVFLCRKELMDEAEVQFLKAINVPSYIRVSESYENLALCQLKVRNFEKTELYLQKAIDHSPSRGTSLYEMMKLQYAKGDYQVAKAYSRRFEKSSRRFPPEFLALAYKNYLKLGDTEKANNYSSMLVTMHANSWHAKQFILNGLESLDADDLAVEYQILHNKEPSSTVKKRVVVLAPDRKKAPVSIKRKVTKPELKKAESLTQVQAKQAIAKTASNVSFEAPEIAKDALPADEQQTSAKPKKVIVLSPSKKKLSKTKPEKKLVAQTKAKTQVSAKEQPQVEVEKSAEVQLTQVDNQLVQQQMVVEYVPNKQVTNEQATDQLIADISNDSFEQGKFDDDNLPDTLEEIEAELRALEAEIPEAAQTADNTIDESASTVIEQSDNEAEKIISEVPVSVEAEESIADEPLTSEPAADELAIEDNGTQERAAEESVQTVETNIQQTTELNGELATPSDNTSAEQPIGVAGSEQIVYHSIDQLPTHKLADGENLFKVSRRYNIHLHALRKWNNLDQNSVLMIGDVIYLADPSLVNANNSNEANE